MHLKLAWLMWVLVGTILATVGTHWIWQSSFGAAAPIIVVSIAVGLLKSRLVLDRVAHTTIDRIRIRGDGRCLGGFLSVHSWGLVLVMIVGGRLLRGTLAHATVGPLYLAVGTALCVSSRLTWRAIRGPR